MKYKSIIAGVVIFLARYIPIYETGGLVGRLSLRQGAKICSTWLGGMAPQCNWVTPLDWGFIAVSAGLIIYGLVQIEKIQKLLTGVK